MRTTCFLLVFFQFIFLGAQEYPYNPHVDLWIWERLEPYFLPVNHPIKRKLDRIFHQKNRIVSSRNNLRKAGFSLNNPGELNLVVGSHYMLKGFLIKAYTDEQDCCETDNFYKRVTGSMLVKDCIERHGFERYFVVPKKWIYPLPIDPSPDLSQNSKDVYRKNFILVVEDMNILSTKENRRYFLNKITQETLDALYLVISEEGLIDSIYINNIPATKTGKLAFIDIEHVHCFPVPYKQLLRRLSPEMQNYWNILTQNK